MLDVEDSNMKHHHTLQSHWGKQQAEGTWSEGLLCRFQQLAAASGLPIGQQLWWAQTTAWARRSASPAGRWHPAGWHRRGKGTRPCRSGSLAALLALWRWAPWCPGWSPAAQHRLSIHSTEDRRVGCHALTRVLGLSRTTKITKMLAVRAACTAATTRSLPSRNNPLPSDTMSSSWAVSEGQQESEYESWFHSAVQSNTLSSL